MSHFALSAVQTQTLQGPCRQRNHAAGARVDQVVTLYARLIGEDSVYFCIDDGVAVPDDRSQEGR
ncbi:hypothetical protein D3C73_838160 [compost metagenome]